MSYVEPRSPSRQGNLLIAFVGYRGHQGSEYLGAISLMHGVSIVGLVDSAVTGESSQPNHGSPVFSTTSDMIAAVHPDVAVVTVPHDQHYPVVAELVAAGIHVLVEKPLVPDWDSAKRLLDLSVQSGRSILTLTQRPLRPEFRYLNVVLPRIGTPYWAEWTYSMAFPSPTSGWRSEWNRARGGVMLDMGYHALDVLVRLFGRPRVIGAHKSYRYEESRDENLEDLMSASLDFPETEVGCHVLVARHAREKRETLELHGTRGTISVDVRHPRVTLYGVDGSIIDEYVGAGRASDAPAMVLSHYLDLASDHVASVGHLRHHVDLVALCESLYEAADDQQVA